MNRKKLFFVCGSGDFYHHFRTLFAKSENIVIRHFPNLAEALLEDDVPSAWFFESNRLSISDPKIFEKICYKVSSSLSLGLIVTKSVEEVFFWKQAKFKPLQLLYGPFTAKQIVERIHSLYEERVNLNLPKVLLFADPDSNHVLLEKNFGDYGLRVKVMQPHELEILPEILHTESCNFLVWNVSVQSADMESVYNVIRKSEKLKGLKIYFVKNDGEGEADKNGTAWHKRDAKVRKSLMKASDVKAIVTKVLRDINAAVETPMVARDRRCGILDVELFMEFLRKNLVNRYLRFHIPNLADIRQNWGLILAHSLENELIFYIKNHVRLSDVVGRGVEADVFLSSRQSDEDVLLKIAERICRGFTTDILQHLGITGAKLAFDILSIELACGEPPRAKIREEQGA